MKRNRNEAEYAYTGVSAYLKENGSDLAKGLGLYDGWLDKIKPYEDAHKFAHVWYDYIPPFGSDPFISYIVASRELALIVDNIKDLRIHVSENDIMGSADQKNNIIYLSTSLFSKSWMNRISIKISDYSSMAVSTVNGVILHEAAHFSQSNKTISDTLDELGPSNPERRTVQGHIIPSIMNTGEDIYIEDWLIGTFPTYLPFLQSSHEYFFSDLEFVTRLLLLVKETQIVPRTRGIKKGSKRTSERTYKIPGLLFLDILIMLKNWRFEEFEFGPFIKPYQEKLKEFKGIKDSYDRARLALEITNQLVADPNLFWPEVITEEMKITSLQGDYDKDSGGMAASTSKKEQLEKEKEDPAAAKLTAEIGDALRKATMDIELQADDALRKIPTIIVDNKLTPSSQKVKPDKRFLSLGRSLRYALTRNYAPGEPRKKGTVMVPTRLARIVTDGKIFSHYERRQRTAKDYEIVILVDASGSMGGTKIVEAMQVGVAAYISLRRARVYTMLYCHTSTTRGSDDTPILYLLGKQKDSFKKVQGRAHRFLDSSSGMLRNNYDGFAVDKVAELGFTDKVRKKWLIVISDGQPAGAGYGGASAIAQTGRVVEKARKRGIEVVSVTIEKGAWEVNDQIYGARRNVKTEDIQVLRDLITAMFIKGGKRGKKIGHTKGS